MNWTNYELLEIVEYFAESEGWIASEDELSDRFDDMVEELIEEGSNIDTEDEVGMSEWFNNWTDSLCKDGEVHPEQYSKYGYVGKWS